MKTYTTVKSQISVHILVDPFSEMLTAFVQDLYPAVTVWVAVSLR